MNKSLTILLTVLALSIALPAAAKPCAMGTSTATPLPGGMYLVNDVCQLQGCVLSVYLYEESNGIPGLQRADARVDNTCFGHANPDSRVF